MKPRWIIEIKVDDDLWRRVGKPFCLKKTAKSWLSFVRAAWDNREGRIVRFLAELQKVERMEQATFEFLTEAT